MRGKCSCGIDGGDGTPPLPRGGGRPHNAALEMTGELKKKKGTLGSRLHIKQRCIRAPLPPLCVNESPAPSSPCDITASGGPAVAGSRAVRPSVVPHPWGIALPNACGGPGLFRKNMFAELRPALFSCTRSTCPSHPFIRLSLSPLLYCHPPPHSTRSFVMFSRVSF